MASRGKSLSLDHPPPQATKPEVHGEYVLAKRLLKARQYPLAALHFSNYPAQTSGGSLKTVALPTLLPLLPLLRMILAANDRFCLRRPNVLRYIDLAGSTKIVA